MILSRETNTTVRCRLYDATGEGTPEYRLRIFSRYDEAYLIETDELEDLSDVPARYNEFEIDKDILQIIPPGNYKYQFVDAADDNRILERGRLRIENNNDELITYNGIDTIIRQTVTA